MPLAWKAIPTGVLLSCVAVVAMSHFGCRDAGHAEKAAASHLPTLTLRTTRSSPLDLEVGGEISGMPAGSSRYLRRADLLALPWTSSFVTDDPNFARSVRIGGVLLEDLARTLARDGDSALVVAICYDRYRANYPREYMAAHHPVLVLTINGADPDDWPKNSEDPGMGIGPFLISHAKFAPSFRVLSHADEAQIPWGVIRVEFRNEKSVFGAIAPRGPQANDEAVKAGYRIAEQNCFRCHNMGDEGGLKAGRPWEVIAMWASASPQRFASYVRSPQAVNPKAEMPAFAEYDDPTIAALRAYFATFADAASDGKKP
jgi:mono/diheme cytochrome c family protein